MDGVEFIHLFICLGFSSLVGYLMPKPVLFQTIQFSIFTQVWFGLVSLFNGISTFVGYLMPKPFS